jgi:hypothetical protein
MATYLFIILSVLGHLFDYAPNSEHGSGSGDANSEDDPPGRAIDLVHGGAGRGNSGEALERGEDRQDYESGHAGWNHF